MKRILPASFYNPFTLAGSVIAGFNLVLIVFLLIVDFMAKRPRPFSDLIILFILPLFILIGVAFIILGIVRQRRRQSRVMPAEQSSSFTLITGANSGIAHELARRLRPMDIILF
jgi:hypothetical protein